MLKESEDIMYPEERLRIGLGNICMEINCNDQEFMDKARTDYRPFLMSRQPDFWVKLNLRNKMTAPEVKHLLRNSRSYLEGGRFFTKPELLECRINWEEATLWVATEKELFSAEVDYKLMNILMRGIYSGFYKKVKNTSFNAYLIHGCGIADEERCCLFTGPSGSGKTTIASLADGRRVLNDETVLIGRNKEGFYLSGTPFDGGVSSKCSVAAHLSAIFFLKHDTKVSLRQLNGAEAYHRFLGQVFNTSPLFEPSGFECLSEQADLSTEVATQVPSYELGFHPDSSFWEIVRNI